MARIQYTKQQVPIIEGVLTASVLKTLEISGYNADGGTLTVPSSDISLDIAVELDRRGLSISAYEIFFEVPDANLSDNIPAGVSFATFEDDSGNTINRIWSDLPFNASGDSLTIRYWQSSNSGTFIGDDVTVLEEAGFTVYDRSSRSLRLQDTTVFPVDDPADENPVTILQIDNEWAFNFYDFVHAHNKMKEVFLAKGIDEDAAWAACTTQEKIALVKWNQVGLAKANEVVPPSWSDTRKIKTISKAYREFNTNVKTALEKRFDDWYNFVMLLLSNGGRTKFDSDWNWNLKDEYIRDFLRHYELGSTNALVDFNDTTLGGYTESDWIGTIPAATIVNNLNKTLTDDRPPV